MARRAHIAVPEGVPALHKGRHSGPRDGGCFMEIASLLAGERWSDHPRCTHALIAMVARNVNDHVGHRTRQRLLPLIPDVVGTRRRHPMSNAAMIGVLTEYGLPLLPGDRDLRWAARAAERRFCAFRSGGRWRRCWLWVGEPFFYSDAGRCHARRIVAAIAATGDEDALVTLLRDVVRAYHAGMERSVSRDSVARTPHISRLRNTARLAPDPPSR